ncbi:hypothetical protein EGW08_018345 [Elysia chlorotica]|uniref:RBR-type E3 ubiquitin transferase n=1 Tax=Elysia chlorotica TaxID=188477 RepID=A0A3S1B1K3_ELYCH|nr:hypothetical protein EGW08_018345 [Elysia chlorotica]
MGSASSKLRKHLQSGDEVQALRLYRSDSELRKVLDPNCSYGDSHQHETPLHLAARNGMQTLLGIFLFSKGGNPNKTNSRKETALHCVCMESNSQSLFVCNRRAMCLNYLLKWRGAKLEEGQVEKIDLAAQDEKLNTALHYAAASGLTQCVEILIQVGAPLFLENEDNFTPCDTAERNGHAGIALYLESKMVFSNDDELPAEEDNISMPPVEEYTGMRPQDLQEAKDQLLVETADMLSVPLFTAEALLRNHEWSRETLLEAWMTDPVACCDKCGVMPPPSLFSDKPQVQENLASPVASSSTHSFLSFGASSEAECDICADTFLLAEEPVHMTCSHRFCKHCWEKYLNLKIQEGDAHHITCPAYSCSMLVPVEIIEGIVSRDMALRYLQFDIKAFVDSNPDMKWCPAPGCGQAVKLPDIDGLGAGKGGREDGAYGNRYSKIPQDTSRGVDCGMGHYFCWECLEESHEPCSCENWIRWFHKISEIRPETLDGTEQETELAANCLWLVTNSKACPNCKSPIQKNEGCNHMKCSKCKYDFCWVCLEHWKRHNTSTGGYFKCNRFEVVKKVEEQNAQMVTEAESKNKHIQELNRFVHYYSRFKNHENSYKLEEPLLKTAKDKMMKLAEAVTDNATANIETKFVEEAVQQLLKARRMLKCSYVYGFYLDGPGYKKIVFEFMQTELEECTEILSQMVNRLYLRTPRRRIVEQARAVQRKRLEFITAISKGLVPPETPPSARKGKKKKRPSGDTVEDEDLRKAILASIQEVDPANPWIKDASGRHTNVASLLEWPAEDSDDSDGEADSKEKHERIGKCHRAGCNKVRARNPKTNEIHEYCSMWCLLIAQEDENKEEGEGIGEIVLDEHMELLRALEMSRLQYLQDSGLLHVFSASQDMDSPEHAAGSRHKKKQASSAGAEEGKERGKEGAAGMSSMEELGYELQRFQELSSTFPMRDCDSDGAQGASASAWTQSRRRDEVQSTIVPRVPNKSVEDLYCLDQPHQVLVDLEAVEMVEVEDCENPVRARSSSSSARLTSGSVLASALDQGEEDAFQDVAATPEAARLSSGAATGSSPRLGPSSSSSCVNAERIRNASTDRESVDLPGSMFGTIKDISISNIHASESDKTKDFLSKDLAAIFAGWDPEDFEETTKSATASAPVSAVRDLRDPADNLSSSEEEMVLLPLPDLHIMSSSDGLDQEERSERAGLAGLPQGSGYARRPLTLDTASAAKSSGFGFDSFGSKVVDSAESSQFNTASAQSKGREPFLAHSSSPGSKNISDANNSNGNWVLRKRVDKWGLPSHTEGPERRRQKESSIDTQGTDEDASLLEMAENLMQMRADVHSRMQEVKKRIQDVPETSRSMSSKTKSHEGSGEKCFRKEKHMSCRSKENPRSRPARSSSGSLKLLGKDRETRILCDLPKSEWSLYRDEGDGTEEESYSFEKFLHSSHWSPQSQRHSSGSYPLDHSSSCSSNANTFSAPRVEHGAISDVDGKKQLRSERDQNAKGARRKHQGKSKKSKHKPQAVAVMSDEAGHSHAVAVTVNSSRRSPGLSPPPAIDLVHSSLGFGLSDGKIAARARDPPITVCPRVNNLSKPRTRQLEEDEYACRVRESASSMFPQIPSPPPPAPPSPGLQFQDGSDGGLLRQSQSTCLASASEATSCPIGQGSPQNVIEYCLRRNIDSGTLGMSDGSSSASNANNNRAVRGDRLEDETGSVASALSTSILDQCEQSVSDGDTWEDASAMLPREEEGQELLAERLEVASEDTSEAKHTDSVYV